MKSPYFNALSTGAIFGLLLMTPAFAQVAGNPGDQHTQTLYMQQYKGLRGYTARAPEPANTTKNCDVVHDFNTSQSHFGYISVCPLFPFH
jgi:hypothetical protein